MTTREEEIINKTINVLKQYVSPEIIYLFGSRAKNAHRKGSDFDIAVTGQEPNDETKENIKDAIEDFIGLYRVDIIYLDSVAKDFRELVLHQGKVVYEK